MQRLIVLCLILAVYVIGCAGIEVPSPQEVLPPWTDGANVHLGESKDSVRSKWGEPDEIRYLGADEVGLHKEEWIYRDRYPEIPVEGILFRGSRLTFTGDSLTAYGADKDSSGANRE